MLNTDNTYSKVLLKLSGEILSADSSTSNTIDKNIMSKICNEIKKLYEEKIQVAIVVGGGNIIRGVKQASATKMDRATADYMGMLATTINALELQSHLEQLGVDTRMQTAFEIKSIAEPYIRRKAMRHLEKGRIVILSGGTGNPFFTTDTSAALKASELGMEIILKATKVNGVYEEDPSINPNAKFYDEISYWDVLQKRINIMDQTAFSLCMENKIPIQIFNMHEKNALIRIILENEKLGTLVK